MCLDISLLLIKQSIFLINFYITFFPLLCANFSIRKWRNEKRKKKLDYSSERTKRKLKKFIFYNKFLLKKLKLTGNGKN